MASALGEFRMEANFEGLVRLLATNLYGEPDVFIRELVQNAHDSIIRRRAEQADFQGSIAVEIRRDARQLVFRDNGIGMSLDEIKKFLSVIGSTGTGGARAALESDGRDTALALIGQFGIGLLSAFVVAEEVIVRTRRQGSDDAFAWRNRGSATYELSEAPDTTEAGTEITVLIADGHSYILDPKRVRDAIVKYCDLLPVPITIDGKGPINVMEAPWHREHYGSPDAQERAYRDYVERRFPDIALDVIPFRITEPYRASGVLYISDRHIPDVNTTGVVDVFVRRMLVIGNDTDVLPPWAKFVRGVIDSPDLQPTGARDNIKRSEPAFLALKEHLGRLIVERLRHLAKHEPRKFRQINAWHHYHLKGMAYHYDDFFEDVVDVLLFDTNNGPMALEDYLVRNSREAGVEGLTPIYYFAYRDSAAQFYRLADARRWVVINAGYMFEEELLQKYARKNAATVRLERLDATDDPDLFVRLEPEREEAFRPLELEMEGQLRRQGATNVEVRVREFDPSTLPAVVIVTPESEASVRLRRMVTHPGFGDLEEVAREALREAGQRPVRLFINAKSEVIRSLLAVDRADPVATEAFLAIYNAGILYSHGVLDRSSADAIHGQYVRMTEMLLAQAGELRSSQQLLSSQRQQVRSLRESAEDASRPSSSS